LLHGSRLTLLAQGQFVLDHLPRNAATLRLLEERRQLNERAQTMNAEAAKRWSGVDPFPGQWWEPLGPPEGKV
jgi:hypothetical protein